MLGELDIWDCTLQQQKRNSKNHNNKKQIEENWNKQGDREFSLICFLGFLAFFHVFFRSKKNLNPTLFCVSLNLFYLKYVNILISNQIPTSTQEKKKLAMNSPVKWIEIEL